MEYQCILFDVVLFIYKYLNVGTLEQRDNKSGFYRKQKIVIQLSFYFTQIYVIRPVLPS